MPASVWTFDTSIPATTSRWPAPIVERVLASFAHEGGTVIFIHWPDTDPTPGPATTSDRGSKTESGGGASTASELGPHGWPEVEAAVGLGGDWAPRLRNRPGPEAGAVDEAVASARAHGYRARAVTAPASSTFAEGDSVRVMSEYVAEGSADLVITAAPPHAVDDCRADAVTLLAARVLRAGGILAVLTHSDWSSGVLHDPTGTVVTAGQSADLLYLQHLVAVHHPLAPSSKRTPDQQPDPQLGQHDLERHGPGQHRRTHSDVLVLVQPHDHALDLPNAAAA